MKKHLSLILTTCSVISFGLALSACHSTQEPPATPQMTSLSSELNSTVVVPIIIEHPTDPVVVEQTQQSLPKSLQPVLQEPPKKDVNIEKPIRCDLPTFPKEIISTIPLKDTDFKLTRIQKTDTLPRFEVNGYTFKNQPLDMALQTLLSEAGIKVFSDDGLFPEISAEDVRGELSAVVDELADTGDVYARYSAKDKKLYLSRYTRFALSVPAGRIGMYAVLDALRGAGIEDIQPDWKANELYMRLTKPMQATVVRLLDYLKTDPQLLMLDVQVYRLTPKKANAPLNWQDIVNTFGVKKVNMSVNGVMGKLIISSRQNNQTSLENKLKTYANVTEISRGVAVMPSGWKVRFDIGQCIPFDSLEKDLSLTLQSNIQNTDRVESNIAVSNGTNEATSFYSFYNIDDDLNIIGLSSNMFGKDLKNTEYAIILKPRLIRLQQKD